MPEALVPRDRSSQGGRLPRSAPRRATARWEINGRPFEDYFPSATHRMIITEPLRLTEHRGSLRHHRQDRRRRQSAARPVRCGTRSPACSSSSTRTFGRPSRRPAS